MRIFENGVYRDATPEEEAAYAADTAGETAPSADERIAALEDELAAAKILLGVD